MSNRNRITDEQRNVLERLYKGRMVGTGCQYKTKIDSAMDETGLTEAQIKKWIGNQKRVKKHAVSEKPHITAQTLKRSKAARGPSPYNLFCSDVYKRDKSRIAAAEWSKIKPEDKEKYKTLSVASKTINVNELTDVHKEKLVARHTKRLLEEITILADLGCEISTLVVDTSGNVSQAGSSDGNQFLSSNPEIGIKFREYFGESHRRYNRSDVQNLFNRKYSEAVGKICRVPYLKRGFEVVGMPEGIEFKKPFNYGAYQIRRIMEASADITFVINDHENLLATNMMESASAPTEMPNIAEIKSLLENIAGLESAEKVLANGSENILEEDVEVVDLRLTEGEKALLYTSCSHYFSPDAWLAVGHNMCHDSETKNLLLPIYTEAEERFWLFLVKEKPSKIAKSVSSTKIKGRWLNLEANGQYSILKGMDSIVGKNIVRTAHGPLYFSCTGNLDDAFELPGVFRETILKVLDDSGLASIL